MFQKTLGWNSLNFAYFPKSLSLPPVSRKLPKPLFSLYYKGFKGADFIGNQRMADKKWPFPVNWLIKK